MELMDLSVPVKFHKHITTKTNVQLSSTGSQKSLIQTKPFKYIEKCKF